VPARLPACLPQVVLPQLPACHCTVPDVLHVFGPLPPSHPPSLHPSACSPPDSSAWIPGSTKCLRCANGVPRCVAGSGCTDDGAASSPGNHIVSLVADATCSNSLMPAIYDTCAMTSAATKLSVRVAGDCSIAITPIADADCSEEGNAYYAGLRIQAFYKDVTAIRSLLPATNSTAGSSSFLLSLDQSSTADQLTFTTWEATTDASINPDDTACTVEMSPIGGQVVGLPTSIIENTACPDGSYSSSMDSVLDPTGIEYCMPW